MLGRDARGGNGNDDRQEAEARGPVREERRVAAWIGASVVVTGDVASSEDMTIAGRVEGDVAVREHTLVIAPGARIQGDIVARSVAVHGEVTGAITADRLVEVGETGKVTGDIKAPRMAVTEGATLHGRVGITTPSRQPA